MKPIFILAILFFTYTTYGQVTSKDSTIKVLYVNDVIHTPEAAYFLNGKLVDRNILNAIKPDAIDSISVIKDNIQIDNNTYAGQVYIKTKSTYQPKLITLNALKGKYTNLESKSVVFMLDGNIVKGDYDKYLVDEGNVLQIVVDNIKDVKVNTDLYFIKILTKSEENIKRSKNIIIRGEAVSLAK
jgi:hypothetical protein